MHFQLSILRNLVNAPQNNDDHNNWGFGFGRFWIERFRIPKVFVICSAVEAKLYNK